MKYRIVCVVKSPTGYMDIEDKVEAKSQMFAIIKFLCDLRLCDTQEVFSVEVVPGKKK